MLLAFVATMALTGGVVMIAMDVQGIIADIGLIAPSVAVPAAEK